jgi:S1-C subfamily serine protease
MADYFFVSPPRDLPPAAKMGILLESRQEGKSSSLRISGFSPESGADEAGMRKDDVLLTVNDLPVRDMDDVRIALLDAKSGDAVRVTVERIEKKGEQPKRKEVAFKLITPAEGRPHP